MLKRTKHVLTDVERRKEDEVRDIYAKQEPDYSSLFSAFLHADHLYL